MVEFEQVVHLNDRVEQSTHLLLMLVAQVLLMQVRQMVELVHVSQNEIINIQKLISTMDINPKQTKKLPFLGSTKRSRSVPLKYSEVKPQRCSYDRHNECCKWGSFCRYRHGKTKYVSKVELLLNSPKYIPHDQLMQLSLPETKVLSKEIPRVPLYVELK